MQWKMTESDQKSGRRGVIDANFEVSMLTIMTAEDKMYCCKYAEKEKAVRISHNSSH